MPDVFHSDIKQPTEGEEFVMDFLKEVGINYEREKKIVGLKGDTRQYRIADFYLPRYDVYIEFFGLWSKNVKDDDYKAKKLIYRNNGIACVYLYPENLGVLAFSLDKRIQRALIENCKYKELRKYRWFKFLKGRIGEWFFGSILLSYLISLLITYKSTEVYHNTMLVVSLIIGFIIYRLYNGYRSIFITNKFPLNYLLDK